jgi:ATP-dependent exoDNAse (exonuclease V) beta subunit
VAVADVAGRDSSFSGPAFGALVHAVLAQAPFDADDRALQDAARIEARILSLGEPAAVAAAARAFNVFRHALMSRAARSASRGACRREAPVTFRLPDGTILEGVVDLTFQEDGCWTVVEYKSDREIAEAGEGRYRRQVAVYACAIARATGQPTSGVLLRI